MTAQADLHAIATQISSGRHKAALKSARAAMRKYPKIAQFANLAGLAQAALGQNREAAAAFQTAIKLAPAFAEAHKNLAQTLIVMGLHDKAGIVLRRQIKAQGNDADLHYLLAQALAFQNQPAAAEDAASRALELAPKMSKALNLRGVVRDQLGRQTEALADYSAAIGLNPNDIEALINVSLPLTRQNRHRDAMRAIEQALRINPDHPRALLRHAVQLNEAGQTQAAISAWHRLLAVEPGHPTALSKLAGLLPLPDAVALVPRLQKALRQTGLADADRGMLLFALSDIARRSRDRETETRLLQDANAALARATPYNAQDDAAHQSAIRSQMFGEQASATMDTVPIFVVGLPRSGTTLAETILSAHPLVEGLGERATAGLLLAQPVSDAGVFDRDAADRLAAGYRAALPELGTDTIAFVDKMPENYRYIGYLAAAFPKARFVHMIRDPRDTALSMWRTYFAGTELAYSYDLAAMAHHANQYRQTMNHWQSTLPDGTILDLHYRDLVTDIDAASRGLAGYCNLDWLPEMARPQDSTTPVLTASVNQVRQPVHTKSLGIWEPYADTLAPFIGALDPALWPELG